MSKHAKNDEEILALMKGVAGRVKPHPGPGGYHSRAGDCVFYMFENVDHTARRIDSVLTVYLADDDSRRIVGVQIKGIRKILQRYGESVRLEVRGTDGKSRHVIAIWPLVAHSLKHGTSADMSTPERRDVYMDVISLVSPENSVDAEELEGALA